MKCDICGTALTAGGLTILQGKEVSIKEMKIIVRNGFAPNKLGIDTTQMDEIWRQEVLADRTPWMLCPYCYEKTRPFAEAESRLVEENGPIPDREVESTAGAKSKSKGAVLIGCGFMPTQADVHSAVEEGHIKNCDIVSTARLPSDTDEESAYMAYLIAQEEKGWEDPGGLQAVKLNTSDGRQVWCVYPTDGTHTKMENCRGCGRSIESGKLICPYCGYTDWSTIIIEVVVSLFFFSVAIFLSPHIGASKWQALIRWGAGLLGVMCFLHPLNGLIQVFRGLTTRKNRR